MKFKILFFHLIFFSFAPCFLLNAQPLEHITELPDKLFESSAVETANDGTIWTLNDSGGEAAIYKCDLFGNISRTVYLNGRQNRDWEDMCRDDEGNIYVGDIGNNSNNYRYLYIYKIPDPDLHQKGKTDSEEIRFYFEDQKSYPPRQKNRNFDCESMFWFNDSIYLLTKHRTMPMATNLYVIPAKPGKYVAKKRGHFKTGQAATDEHPFFDYWICSADISPDGKKVALLTGNKVWIFHSMNGSNFLDGHYELIPLGPNTQKEALVFKNNDELWITDEYWRDRKKGGNLYCLKLE